MMQKTNSQFLLTFREEDIMRFDIFTTLFLSLVTTSLLVASSSSKKVVDFTLSDLDGVKHTLSDYKDSKAIVLMFVSTQCPVSNAYNTRMVELYKDYTKKSVAFVGLNSNKTEDIKEIKEHAKEQGFEFPILKDVNNVIADKLEASFTPEIYVLNGNLELLYHGRIDDSRRLANVSSKDLRAALDQTLAGMPVSVSTTKAFGCTIKRVSK